jgi:hypothetical protein
LRLILRLRFIVPGSAGFFLAARSLQSLLGALRTFLNSFLGRSTALRRGAFRRFLGPFRLVSALTGRLSIGVA